MMLDRGKWSKNDKFKITDFTGDDAPVDDFKQSHTKQVVKDSIADKPTQIIRPKDSKVKREQGQQKWTTVENMFSRKKERLFDTLPSARLE